MAYIIAGNWKMNGSKEAIDLWAKDFFAKAIEFEKSNPSAVVPHILLALPSIYVPYAKEVLADYNAKTTKFKVSVGAQDIHPEETGAYTGSISVKFLNDFDCSYTLVGHSERRLYQFEKSELIALKAVNAIKNNVVPVICIGESLEIREGGKYLDFLKDQVLKSTPNVDLEKAIIAYEPVWAIGTGKVPSSEDIEEVCDFVKKLLAKDRHTTPDTIKVLYGGSVKSSNTKEITGLASVDGVLVGGASLKGEEFFNIVVNSIN